MAKPASTLGELEPFWRGDRRGLRLLLDLLAANQVVEQIGDEIGLTPQFRSALRFRELLEAKLDFANLAAPDLIQLFPWLLVDPDRFMQKARIFNLFDYSRCLEPSPENFEATRRWMRFTTFLTRYEAPVCMRHHDFSRYSRMLDVGGNSGEFVLRICKTHPEVRATVFDLPVVCEIGREHVGREPEASRIDFVKGSALVDPLPTGCDLITFKSILHDWSNDDATRLLTRASEFLGAGGTILIFETRPHRDRDRKGAVLDDSDVAVLPQLPFPAFLSRATEGAGVRGYRDPDHSPRDAILSGHGYSRSMIHRVRSAPEARFRRSRRLRCFIRARSAQSSGSGRTAIAGSRITFSARPGSNELSARARFSSRNNANSRSSSSDGT